MRFIMNDLNYYMNLVKFTFYDMPIRMKFTMNCSNYLLHSSHILVSRFYETRQSDLDSQELDASPFRWTSLRKGLWMFTSSWSRQYLFSVPNWYMFKAQGPSIFCAHLPPRGSLSVLLKFSYYFSEFWKTNEIFYFRK